MSASRSLAKDGSRRHAPPHAWKPGMSGNPRGRAPALVDIAALARKHGPKCIEVAYNLMMRDKDSKVRLAACVALLDRGFGRPKQEIETNGNATIELHLVAARLVSEQLMLEDSGGAPGQRVSIEPRRVIDASEMPTE
jgi:hypothetical protein